MFPGNPDRHVINRSFWYAPEQHKPADRRTLAKILSSSGRHKTIRRAETRFKPFLLSNDKWYHNDIKVVKYGLSRCKNGIYPSCYHMFRAEKAARRRSIMPGPRPDRVRSTQPVSQPLVEPRRPGAVLSRFFGLFWSILSLSAFFLRDFFLRLFCDKTFHSAWNHIFLHQLGYNLRESSRVCTI